MKNTFTDLFLFALLSVTAPLKAEIMVEPVEYHENETVLEGIFVHDSLAEGPQPGVIIFHQWGGPGEYELTRARMLASLGYAVLVADVYGKGIRPTGAADRGAIAGSFRADRPMTRARAQAAYDLIKSRSEVNADKIAAIGYCFGGFVALELARSGAPAQAVVSIHGSLNTPTPEDAKNIQAAVLVQHGAIDPYVPEAEVEAFKKEMDDAGVTYEFIAYAEAVHAFTDWSAGDDPSTGVAYNADADKLSWEDLLAFLGRQLKQGAVPD